MEQGFSNNIVISNRCHIVSVGSFDFSAHMWPCKPRHESSSINLQVVHNSLFLLLYVAFKHRYWRATFVLVF